jgi:hypothetical protein
MFAIHAGSIVGSSNDLSEAEQETPNRFALTRALKIESCCPPQ